MNRGQWSGWNCRCIRKYGYVYSIGVHCFYVKFSTIFRWLSCTDLFCSCLICRYCLHQKCTTAMRHTLEHASQQIRKSRSTCAGVSLQYTLTIHNTRFPTGLVLCNLRIRCIPDRKVAHSMGNSKWDTIRCQKAAGSILDAFIRIPIDLIHPAVLWPWVRLSL
jgi:hypothetical protein